MLPSEKGSRGPRSRWVDEARFWLVFLIVMGHAISIPTLYVPEKLFWLQPVLIWGSFFHMQAFAFISGLLSKGPLTEDRGLRLVVMLFLPYIFSKSCWWGVNCLRAGKLSPLNLFDTYSNGGLEWYLASLITWRLWAPMLSAIRPRLSFAIALLVGHISGFWVSNIDLFALQRSCAFLPFFSLGLLLDVENLKEFLCHKGFAVLFGLTFIAIWIVPHVVLTAFDLGTLGDLNYDYTATRLESGGWNWLQRPQCGFEWALSFVHRSVRYLLGFFILLGFLGTVTHFPLRWAQDCGQRTMYPYLLHPWVIDFAFMPIMQHFSSWWYYSMNLRVTEGGWIWALCGVVALPLTIALSSQMVQKMFHPLVEPKWIQGVLQKPPKQKVRGYGYGTLIPC